MFGKSAEFYDAIYNWKDYAAEAERIHSLIQQHKRSGGNSLLDVACGTGAHLAFLKTHYRAEGLDLSAELLAIARERCPDLRFHHGDMETFELGRRFDAVICLFSSIGYVGTVERMERTVQNFVRHLLPGGVLIIEPWFAPGEYQPGYLGAVFVDRPGLKIARMQRSEVANGLSVLNFHYLVGTAEGVAHFTERHELGMFPREAFLGVMAECGLDVVYDSEGVTGRGLYTAVLRD